MENTERGRGKYLTPHIFIPSVSYYAEAVAFLDPEDGVPKPTL